MKASQLTAILLFKVVTLTSAFANVTIGLGPFTASVPDSWSVEKALGESKLQASAPDSKSIGDAKIPVMVRIEEKKKIGDSLADLQEFLTRKLSTSPDEGKAMIEKGWGDKADRLAVDALKVSKPSIHGVGPNQYLTSTVLSDFDIDGKKLSLITRSYWVYLGDKAYFMRIVTPVELAEQYAGVIDEIARSVKINNGEQAVAPSRSFAPTLNSTSPVRGSED